MLSADKLNQAMRQAQMSAADVAGRLARPGTDKKAMQTAVKNWQKGLYKPSPKTEEIERVASALGVDAADISQWTSSVRYAPTSPRKARLVAQLIAGRDAQDALDILKFTNKRAASMMEKALKCAIADADERGADVENLYVSEARVDGAGVRVGTKRWIAKDRGRAHSIRKMASHIHITVSQAD